MADSVSDLFQERKEVVHSFVRPDQKFNVNIYLNRAIINPYQPVDNATSSDSIIDFVGHLDGITAESPSPLILKPGLGGIDPTFEILLHGFSFPIQMALGVEFNCDTSASTYADIVNGKIANVVLLEHQFSVIPSSKDLKKFNSRLWDSYRVRVRPIKLNDPLSPGEEISTKDWLIPYLKGSDGSNIFGDPWNPDDGFFDNLTPTIDVELHDSRPLSSVGGTTTSEGNSISTSLSASAGFFGETPTGTIGTSSSMTQSTSVSFNVPGITVNDRSNRFCVDKEFVMHPNIGENGEGADAADRNPGRFSFRATAAEIFFIPDDRRGFRSQDAGGIDRYFEISIGAYKLVEVARTDTILIQSMDQTNAWGYNTSKVPVPSLNNDMPAAQVAVAPIKRQIIKVRAPPLPIGVDGLDFPNRFNQKPEGF
ncbi:hypothetical protein QWA68_016732 [Fusarium oxysporum]|nr:hypothetical protein QWA68_016732 [Fusarium oxysporum]